MSMQPRLYDVETALVAPRTLLRRYREGDGAALHELIQDNSSQLHSYFPEILEAVRDKENAERFVRERLADWLLQREYAFGLWHAKDAVMIGMVRISELDWRVPKGRLSFFIAQEYAQQGLMTESLQMAMRFVFHQLQLEKIFIRVTMDNVAAQRLARKCAFRREGDLRDEFRFPEGELADVMLFGLTRAEFLGA
jgi:RimJ/RimL family protein N-acetyltransferase